MLLMVAVVMDEDTGTYQIILNCSLVLLSHYCDMPHG